MSVQAQPHVHPQHRPQHVVWACCSAMWRRSTASIPASVGGLPATHASTMMWRDHEEPDLVTWSSGNRQAFANRFAVNDPLRTCDMHQTLIGLLHYSFEVFTSGGPVLDGRDYGPWVPITVGPWE